MDIIDRIDLIKFGNEILSDLRYFRDLISKLGISTNRLDVIINDFKSYSKKIDEET